VTSSLAVLKLRYGYIKASAKIMFKNQKKRENMEIKEIFTQSSI